MTKQQANRLIAEKCEGLEAIDDQWVKHRDRGGEHGWNDRVRIDDYFTDIAACVRAAEAWRMEDEEYRWYRIDSPCGRGGWFEAVLHDGGKSIQCDDKTPSAALAAALVEAVK